MSGQKSWEDDFKGDEATLDWLRSQKPSTRSAYKWNFSKFLAEVDMTGDEIIADRKNDKAFKWEKTVLDVKIALEKNFSTNTAKSVGTAARSFFAYHRLPLNYRPQEKRRLTESTVETNDYRFSVDDLRRMSKVADLTERYVLIVGKSFGLRAGDFMKLTRGDLEPYIDNEPPISIGRITTKKEGVDAFPFIDSDAKPAIQAMLTAMDAEGRTSPDERMLPYKFESLLSRILKRLVQRAGVNVGNKRVRFHCLRKFLCDRLASYMSGDKWRQIVGKTISESAYISPELLREDYARAMDSIVIQKPELSGNMEQIARKWALLQDAKRYGFTKKDLENGIKFKKLKSAEDEANYIENWIHEQEEKEKQAKKADCTDGKHCQKVVREDELESYLNDGWYVVTSLSSGKVVISND
jgi:integrase